MFSLILPPLPTLNELLAASRKSPYSANALKQRAQHAIIVSMREAGFRRELAPPIRIEADIYAANRRTDCDNLQACVYKFLLDALVECGALPDDGWRQLQLPEPFRTRFYVDPAHPRVEVTIFEAIPPDSRVEASRSDEVGRKDGTTCQRN